MPNRIREELAFSKTTFDHLEELSKKLQCSRSKILGFGLGLLRFAIERLENGEKIVVVKKDGKLKGIVFHFKIHPRK